MTETQSPPGELPAGLQKLLRRFATLPPELVRQALVQYANRFPELPERFRTLDAAAHRVHECQTPVALFAEQVDGKMYYHADVPKSAPTIRALLAMLFEALNGQPPAATLAIPADFVRQAMAKIGLGTREQGLNAMVERLRRAAREAEAERAASG